MEYKKLWSPSDKFIQDSNLNEYKNWLSHSRGLDFHDYNHLWRWSTESYEQFWLSIWEYFDVQAEGSFTKVASGSMPNVKWFEGTTLNYAEHIFRHRSNDRPALYFQNEVVKQEISWDTLAKKVRALQLYLKSVGIEKGDCVCGFLPNIPEAIIAFLAVNSLGAVWSCASPDFGAETVVERFTQIKPKVLISCDGYRYSNKTFEKSKTVKEIRQSIDSIQHCIHVPYLDENSTIPDSILLEEIYRQFLDNELPVFESVPFDHPIWVLYSSGTTGLPKAITHSHGGVLLEHLKYMSLHNDVKEGEYFFWFTTTGWMMWNYLQASMLVGAVPVIFDGSPAYPSMDVLWEMAEELPLHHFGTSAPYLTACMKKELKIKESYSLKNLKSIGSTGAPLPPEVFEWIYKNISEDVWLCSMSGGTDVCTAFVGGNPSLPVYKGLIQSRALGCALYAYDQDGNPINNSLGEMVIEKPMPSMPIYFWNDEGNDRYRKSYFLEYPGKWRHGDWINIFDNGSLIIQGRSDATLNRKGIRIGTAEIYNVLDDIKSIKDSLIINIELDDGGDEMPLFVVISEGKELNDAVKQEINKNLKSQCSPRHVPDRIIAVPDIPYTLSGKKMEVPVKKLFLKMDISKSLNKDAVRNPKALEYFIELAKAYK